MVAVWSKNMRQAGKGIKYLMVVASILSLTIVLMPQPLKAETLIKRNG